MSAQLSGAPHVHPITSATLLRCAAGTSSAVQIAPLIASWIYIQEAILYIRKIINTTPLSYRYRCAEMGVLPKIRHIVPQERWHHQVFQHDKDTISTFFLALVEDP